VRIGGRQLVKGVWEKFLVFKSFPKKFLKYTERLVTRNFFEKELLAKRSFLGRGVGEKKSSLRIAIILLS
jgi:hypothetical protein